MTPTPRLVHGPKWRIVIDGAPWDVIANTKSEARALLKGALGKPLPPGVDFIRIEAPKEK